MIFEVGVANWTSVVIGMGVATSVGGAISIHSRDEG